MVQATSTLQERISRLDGKLTAKQLEELQASRSTTFCEIGARLEAKGVALKVLDQAIDTSTPTGRLMFNLLGSIAQFERELTRERMLVGIAKARADGKYKGRAPTARAKADKVRELRNAGIRPAEIARQVGISRPFACLASSSSRPRADKAQAVGSGLGGEAALGLRRARGRQLHRYQARPARQERPLAIRTAHCTNELVFSFGIAQSHDDLGFIETGG